MGKNQSLIKTMGLGTLCMLVSQACFAVGTGDNYGVAEGQVAGALIHQFQSDSVDFSYKACVSVNYDSNLSTDVLRERGYFWVSSFRQDDAVMESQINHFLANGYAIYAVYEYTATLVGESPTPLDGVRRGYQVADGGIKLYLDPLQDTNLGLPNCEYAYQNTSDDQLIGGSNTVLVGEKSEKEGLSNGDFELVFDNWQWSIASPFVPFGVLTRMSFNGNVTTLDGSIYDNHLTDGSGNLFWRE